MLKLEYSTSIYQKYITWNTDKVAHRRESKFFLEHSYSGSSLCLTRTYLQNLQPKIFIPRILKWNHHANGVFHYFFWWCNSEYLNMKMKRTNREKNVAMSSIVFSMTIWKIRRIRSTSCKRFIRLTSLYFYQRKGPSTH